MEELLADAEKGVLVEIVRLAQKQGLKGAKGGWKDFLNCHDRKFGAGLSDPAKRSTDILVAFLKTFTQKEDLTFFAKMLRCQRNRKAIEQFSRDFPDRESPQQRLVRLTIEHPLYRQHYTFPSHDEEWIITRLGKVSKVMESNSMIAVDCEMVLCQDGTEAVVKVCAVDHNLEVKLDKLVNPNKAVVDYRTEITGVSVKDLEGVTCTLVDVQKSLKKLLRHGTILVGHSLHNDLRALKIDHPRVIDTSYIFKYIDLPTVYTPSLKSLCKSILGFEIRKEGGPHDCLNDAQAAMKLVFSKIDHGFDDPITIAGENVPESDLAKLLLHRIPVDVPSQELLKLFRGGSNINILPGLRVRGKRYSTFAVFKDSRGADEAFRGVEGQLEKDSCGRLQKRVSLKLSTGQTTTLLVRRMTADAPDSNRMTTDAPDSNRMTADAPDSNRMTADAPDSNRMTADAPDSNSDLPKKRLAQDEAEESKRPRMCLQQCDHVKEIEKLKEELCQRDREISYLQKILSSRPRNIRTVK